MVKNHLNIINYPFDPEQVIPIVDEILPIGKYLRTSIIDDAIFNIPYIAQVYNKYMLFTHIPDHYQRNFWIISIRYKEPIMYDSALDELHRHQKRGHTKNMALSFPQRKPSDLTNIQDIHTDFNQFIPIFG